MVALVLWLPLGVFISTPQTDGVAAETWECRDSLL